MLKKLALVTLLGAALAACGPGTENGDGLGSPDLSSPGGGIETPADGLESPADGLESPADESPADESPSDMLESPASS